MRPTDEGSVTMRMFGSLVKTLRESQGLTREDLAEQVGYSKSLVAMVERGVRMPSQAFIDRGEELLQARGVLREAAPYLSRELYPSWFGEYVDREAEAVSVCAYDTLVVKGLAQTEDYARAVLGAYCPMLEPDEIERRVEARLARQALLHRSPPVWLALVMEESVLRRPVGGKQVLKGQLTRLLALAEMRNTSLQVLPMRYETHAGFDGSMTLLETPDRQWLTYLEVQGRSKMIDDRAEISEFHQRYSMLRTQALTPGDSTKLIEQMAGEL